jgi:hypothetical protein
MTSPRRFALDIFDIQGGKTAGYLRVCSSTAKALCAYDFIAKTA